MFIGIFTKENFEIVNNPKEADIIVITVFLKWPSIKKMEIVNI